MKKDNFFFFFWGLFQILLKEQEISRLDFILPYKMFIFHLQFVFCNK